MNLRGRPRRGDRLGWAVIAAADLMYERGLVVGTVGNVSARDGDAFLITPTRRYYDELRPGDLVDVPLGIPETLAAPEASREWRMHAAIYAARPDITAVAHTHSPYATARSFDPTPMQFLTEERSYLGIDRVEVVPASTGGSRELAQRVADALVNQPTCLIARHGVVTGGATPRTAVELAAAVEHQAKIAWLIHRSERTYGPLDHGADLTRALQNEIPDREAFRIRDN